jgi:hypothetical protein
VLVRRVNPRNSASRVTSRRVRRQAYWRLCIFDDGGTPLDIVDETSQLTKRQAELESAMKQRGGARVIEEKELRDVKRRLDTLSLSGQSVEAAKRK